MEPTAWTPTEPIAPTRTEPTPEPEASPGGLAVLIGAEGTQAFLRDAFGKRAHRARIAPEAAVGLFGWPQLNAALAEHRLTPPRLRLERAGGDVTAGVFRSRRTRRGALLQDLDAAALTARLREGATLIVDAVNEISPPLQRLCAELSAQFAASCQANLYACWGQTQGFDVHWDDHEVFVVQVQGRKQWALYGATEVSPTRRGAAAQAADAPQVEPERVVLEPGDVLYLPRGFWHGAVGLGGPTLHLTVGLTRKTGADLLRWLADELLADPAVRADLSFEAGDEAVAAQLAALLARVGAGDAGALARRYRRHVEAGLVQRPQLRFPDIGGDQPLGADARLALAQGAARVEIADGGLVLSWRGVEFTLAPALEAPVRRLVAGQAVPVAAFREAAPEATQEQVEAFLRELLRRGTLIRHGEERR